MCACVCWWHSCFHDHLVQVRLCPQHALHLNYRKNKQALKAARREQKRRVKDLEKRARKRRRRQAEKDSPGGDAVSLDGEGDEGGSGSDGALHTDSPPYAKASASQDSTADAQQQADHKASGGAVTSDSPRDISDQARPDQRQSKPEAISRLDRHGHGEPHSDSALLRDLLL